MPDHVPVDAVSVCPCCARPEIAGGAVFAGGTAATTAVGAEVARVEMSLVAVTTTTNVEPTSAETSVYVADVAPATSAQEAPVASQRRHW